MHSICKLFNPRSIPLSTPDAARSCQVTHVTSLLQCLQKFKAISLRIIYLWCRMQRRAFIGMHLSGRCTPSYATRVRMVDSGIRASIDLWLYEVQCHHSACILRHLVPAVEKRVPRLKKGVGITLAMAAPRNTRTDSTSLTSAIMKTTSMLPVSGIFFRPSHGKGACDGIGRTAKRATWKPPTHILWADSDRTWYVQVPQWEVCKCDWVFVSEDEIANAATDLRTRFASVAP